MLDKQANLKAMLQTGATAARSFFPWLGQQARTTAPAVVKPVTNFAKSLARPASPIATAPGLAQHTPRVLGGMAGAYGGNQMGDKAQVGPTYELGGYRFNPVGAATGAMAGFGAGHGVGQAMALTRPTAFLSRNVIGQAPTMIAGGMAGHHTGHQMLPEADTPIPGLPGWNINLPGTLMGAAMGHKAIRNTAAGQTLLRPAMRASIGSGTGAVFDEAAGAMGIDTKGMGGRIGGFGGLASGFGSNRFLSQRDAYIKNLKATMPRQNTNTWRPSSQQAQQAQRAEQIQAARAGMDELHGSLSGGLHRLGTGLDQVYHGGWDAMTVPYRAMGRYLWNGKTAPASIPREIAAKWKAPSQIPVRSALDPAQQAAAAAKSQAAGVGRESAYHMPGYAGAGKGLGLLGRRVGQITTAAPLYGGAGYVGANMIGNWGKQQVADGVNTVIDHVKEQGKNVLREQGLWNEEKQRFDPAPLMNDALVRVADHHGWVNPETDKIESDFIKKKLFGGLIDQEGEFNLQPVINKTMNQYGINPENLSSLANTVNSVDGVAGGLSQYVNPLLQMLGHQSPDRLNAMQKAMAIGSPLALGAGAMTGNPLLAMLGAGGMGMQHHNDPDSKLNQLFQGLLKDPRYQHLLNNQGIGAPRNEFEAQTNRPQQGAGYASGQGWQ